MAAELNALPVEAFVPEAEEGAARAGVYALIGALLRDVPDAALLSRVEALDPAQGRDAFALAWEGVRMAASRVAVSEIDDEFHILFIGLGRGECVPYGSWYQTGFLMEQPLSVLRRDMAALGFERCSGVHEPEDHIAALCDLMSQIAVDPAVGIEQQQVFYGRHLAPWVERFCADLEAAEGAVFYRSVARLGAAFFALEQRYLNMEILI